MNCSKEFEDKVRNTIIKVLSYAGIIIGVLFVAFAVFLMLTVGFNIYDEAYNELPLYYGMVVLLFQFVCSFGIFYSFIMWLAGDISFCKAKK
jgi:type II secretory pathway component PulF